MMVVKLTDGSRRLLSFAALAAVALMGGCRVKSVDSYLSSTTPNSVSATVNDPYSYGGMAYGSGGLKPGMSYGTGSSGKNDGDQTYQARIASLLGKKDPTWTVPGDPVNEENGAILAAEYRSREGQPNFAVRNAFRLLSAKLACYEKRA